MHGPSMSNHQPMREAEDERALLSGQLPPPVTPVAPVPSATTRIPSPQTREKASLALIWREAILPYLGTRLVLLAVGLFATYYIMPLLVRVSPLPDPSMRMAFPQSLWLMWDHFDSGFYVQIAQHNYWPASTLHRQTNWVFYPLYPLLIAGGAKILSVCLAVSALTGPLILKSDMYYIAGILISNVTSLLMMMYLYLLVRKEFGAKTAARTVLYLAVFPLAFFFSAIFTESLLLGLCIACIYYARRQCWWLAGICGGLAALTRLQGVTLVVPLAWEYLWMLSTRYAPPPTELPTNLLERVAMRIRFYFRGLLLAARVPKNWLNALALFLVPAGLLLFMAYGQWYVHDFFATFHASAWGWRRHISPPWRLLIFSLRNPVLGQPLNWNFWVLNIVAALAALATIIWSWRRLPMIYTLYTAVMVLLPLSSSLLNSYGRYTLLIFPAFILLARFTSKDASQPEHLHTFIVASFAALEAAFMIFFVLGLPTMA